MASKSSSSDLGVQIGLALSVLVAIAFMVMFFQKRSQFNELVVREQQARDEKGKADANAANSIADIDALKTVLGYTSADVGGGGQAPAGSVIGQLRDDLTRNGRDLQKPSVKDTLNALRVALDDFSAQAKASKLGNEGLNVEMNKNREEMEGRVTKHSESAAASETQLQAQIKDKEETIRGKEEALASAEEETRRERVEKEQLRDELANVRKEKDDKIKKLTKIVDVQKAQIEEILQVSFEHEDGQIVVIDNTTRTVSISLGSLDGLRPQTSFSVYTRDHRGIGRGQEDIKAKIEVTEVTGPHQATARIIDEDPHRPIGEGDPIYSPAWSAGMTEYFSVAGVIDFDGDGKSDRKLLKDLLSAAGAEIEVEIDDDGVRQPTDTTMTVKTKFLVLGEFPDPGSFGNQDEKKDAADKMLAERTMLVQEARENGVRPVPLKDFLSYMGVKPKRRLFQPGTQTKGGGAATTSSYKD